MRNVVGDFGTVIRKEDGLPKLRVRNFRVWVGWDAVTIDAFLVVGGPSTSIEWDESYREQTAMDYFWSEGQWL